MSPNPFLARLGFAPDDRVVIFHADDLGMCHAGNAAFADIVANGATVCGSVMVPCPWLNEIAAFARAHPQADIGVHTTLTSEWESYRWGPISTRDPQSGLLDGEGYLWAGVADLWAHMDVAAAVAELRAQVARALAAGIDVTHIDTHMGAILHPALLDAYANLGIEHGIPVLLPRLSEEQMIGFGAPAPVAQAMVARLAELEQDGRLPIIDHITALYAAPSADRMAQYQQALKILPPGITHFLYHAARPGPEIESIAPLRDWPGRVADWEVFSSPQFARWLAAEDIRVVGYRALSVKRET
jgi:predicted glycoside hydrolase/deacetylase ChbG (UPF0249 family)